eukprot:TRINITY_DN1746_c0_g1_i1.p2 TRINITY_DN1746_c0_g1~~TRINITY_DN1746_c0_g1_i1.p2  ORF type:complete len:150 (-),score=30.38 TRINITY_DN1746_c0_g1_i1:33-482(-)
MLLRALGSRPTPSPLKVTTASALPGHPSAPLSLPGAPRCGFHGSAVLCAVPKNRVSRGKKRMRNCHLNLVPKLNLLTCSNCTKAVMAEHVCSCGWKKGKPITLKAIKLWEYKQQYLKKHPPKPKENQPTPQESQPTPQQDPKQAKEATQ